MKVLTLNAGSNSLKFEISEVLPDDQVFGSTLLSGSYDNIGKDDSTFSLLKDKVPISPKPVSVRDHGHAAELLLGWIDKGHAQEAKVSTLQDIERIGHRIVHGGDLFSGPAVITDEVIKQIESLEDLAPLHNKPALKAVRATRSVPKLGHSMVAVFDTVFHQTIPDEAALYGIPLQLAAKHKIKRYGFHGISHRYLALRYSEVVGRSLDELDLVTLHLEGGSSAAAIRKGKSVDTSMGFTPLEGLMMGTRCGDLDPALVTYLMRKEEMNADEVETFLNKKCGLAGVSECSADTRELIKHLEDKSVRLALDIFCYRVRKYLGAYLAVLGSVDAIVLGGGIGENMPILREQILKGLDFAGIVIDREVNDRTVNGEMQISSSTSTIPIWVIPTQENLMMASDVAATCHQS